MSFFRKNITEKLLALIVAIGCWVFVMNDQNPQIENTYIVPVSVINSSDAMQVSKSVDTVKIRVKAPRSYFTTVDTASFKAYVDVGGLEQGIHDVNVKTSLPSGFELIDLNPNTISVSIDPIDRKEVPVRINLSGAPGKGMVVAGIKQSMDNIVVEGPVSLLNQVSAVIGYITVNDNTEDFKVTVPLVAVNDHDTEIGGVHIIPKTVDVSVTLAQGLKTKVVDIKPHLSSDLSTKYLLKSVRVEPQKVQIGGDADKLNKINYISTQPISLADVTETTTKTVGLDVPDGLTVPNEEITVYIEIEKKTDPKTS